MTSFVENLPYGPIVSYIVGVLLTLPVIIGVLVGCAIAVRNMWLTYREAARQE